MSSSKPSSISSPSSSSSSSAAAAAAASSAAVSSATYGLDPNVKIPPSLTPEVLSRCPLELIQDSSLEFQTEALTVFSQKVSTLSSSGADDKKGHCSRQQARVGCSNDIQSFTDPQRQEDLFTQAVAQVHKILSSETKKNNSNRKNNNSSPTAAASFSTTSPASSSSSSSAVASPSHGMMMDQPQQQRQRLTPISTTSASAMISTATATTPATMGAISSGTPARPTIITTTSTTPTAGTPTRSRSLASTPLSSSAVATASSPLHAPATSSSLSSPSHHHHSIASSLGSSLHQSNSSLPDSITPQMLHRLPVDLLQTFSPSQQDAIWNDFAERLGRAASAMPEYVPGTNWRMNEIQNNPPRQEQIFRQTVQDYAVHVHDRFRESPQDVRKQQPRGSTKTPPPPPAGLASGSNAAAAASTTTTTTTTTIDASKKETSSNSQKSIANNNNTNSSKSSNGSTIKQPKDNHNNNNIKPSLDTDVHPSRDSSNSPKRRGIKVQTSAATAAAATTSTSTPGRGNKSKAESAATATTPTSSSSSATPGSSNSKHNSNNKQKAKLKLQVDAVDFEVYGETADVFMALSQDEQAQALQFCQQAIVKRSEHTSSNVRNPAAYFAKTLENYVIHGQRAPIPPPTASPPPPQQQVLPETTTMGAAASAAAGAANSASPSAVSKQQQPPQSKPDSSTDNNNSNNKKNGSTKATAEPRHASSSLSSAAATSSPSAAVPQQQKAARPSLSSAAASSSSSSKTLISAATLYGLDPNVSVPSSLSFEVLSHLPLDQIQALQPSQQEAVLIEFSNRRQLDTTWSSNINNNHPLRRQNELFRRVLDDLFLPSRYDNQKHQQETKSSTSAAISLEKRLASVASVSTPSSMSSSSKRGAPPAAGDMPATTSSSSTTGSEKRSSRDTNTIKTANGRVVRLELEGDSAALFDSLRLEHQVAARKYCEEAARRILNSGKIIQKPTAFYGNTLRTYIKKNILANDSKEEALDFKLSGSASSLYDSLLPDQKVAARQQCMEAARIVLNKGQVIRNPADYFGNTVVNFIRKNILSTGSSSNNNKNNSENSMDAPEFELEGAAAKKFGGLPYVQQVATQKYCEDAARRVIAETGRGIRKPGAFYSKKYFEYAKLASRQAKTRLLQQQQQQQQQQLTTGTTKNGDKEETDSMSGDDYSLRNSQSKESSPSSSSSPNRRKASKAVSNASRAMDANGRSSSVVDSDIAATGSAAAVSADEVSKLRRELLETRLLLEKKTSDCHELTKKCSDLSHMWENEKAIAEAARERFRKLEASVEETQKKEASRYDLLAAMTTEKQEIEQKHEEGQKMLRDMTATFTRVSQELCHEREAKRELEKLLEKERETISAKDLEIQKLKAEVKRMDMLRPSAKKQDGGGKLLVSLRRELTETQEKLAKEKRRNSSVTSKGSASSAPSSSVPREKPSLADFVANATDSTTKIRILKPRSSSATSIDSVSDTTPQPPTDGSYAQEHLRAQLEKDASIYFAGVHKKYDAEGTELEERVKEELDFLALSYGDDELTVEPHRVTRSLRLHIDRNAEVVFVDLLLSIPEGYPMNAPLAVEASLSVEGPSISIEARKVALDALPGLVDVCRCEANGSLGSDALLQVLSVADQWVQNDWVGIQTKRLPATKEVADASCASGCKICRLLVFSHHILDSGKIQFVLKTASKYGLGGYVKTGKPGYILVEGLEDNCDFFMETIVQQRGKLREAKQTKTDSATFQQVAKETARVDDLDRGRLLPKKVSEMEHSKEAMELLTKECTKVGLREYLTT